MPAMLEDNIKNAKAKVGTENILNSFWPKLPLFRSYFLFSRCKPIGSALFI